MKNISINISTYILLLIAFLAGYLKYFLIIFFIIIIHELGHIICFKIFKIPLIKAEIYPFGGMCYIDMKIHELPSIELLCAVAGITFQILLFVVIKVLSNINLIGINTYNYFNLYNKYIMLFNLLPIIPLDGSKIILSILKNFLSYDKCYKLIGFVSFISLGIFIYLNIRYRVNDVIIYTFLIAKLIEWIKNYRYIINKFYLERMINDHHYNEIINNEKNIKNYRTNKYYYMYKDGKYIDEKQYIKMYLFNN